MAHQPQKPHFTQSVTLPDGRAVRVSAYPDGGIRFHVGGLPYVLTEARLGAGPGQEEAVLGLSPGRQGSSASYNYAEWLGGRNQQAD
ncbi:hypothetical protein [Streptomyces sp. SID8352]|uniref:hypothetical protein n=1 Tax=Streptomyces sp. SID8352 TaxID=2690338 RepID=UPI0013717289|nr:hypothetical protein [Streptomyces sp. SID8352]MYU26416.1 hypothetical protein [Streptomyces sp. SID8352]